MPAVIRVKRHIDEEPLSAFVLNGKKRRLEDGSAEVTDAAVCAVQAAEDADAVAEKEISTILKFAATIAKQDDEVTKQLAHSSKDAAKDIVLRRKLLVENLTERSRDEARQHSKENRFRIVNLSRSTLQPANATEPSAKEVTILDVEREKQAAAKAEEQPGSLAVNVSALANGNVQPADSDSGFVYDLYLADDEQQADSINQMDDNHMSVGVYQPELETLDSSDMDDDDSEDSNDENYYGNDYPEESSENEDNENPDYDGHAYYVGEADGMNELELEFANFEVDDDDTSDVHSSSDDDYQQDEVVHMQPSAFILDPSEDDYFDAQDFLDAEAALSDGSDDDD